jgi:hypothetical protein
MDDTRVIQAVRVVSEEIAIALEQYPDFPYKEAFANSEMRQELMAYVLRRLAVFSRDGDGTAQTLSPHKFPYRSLELRLRVEAHIHRGIQQLLCEKAAWFIPSVHPEISQGRIKSSSEHLSVFNF